MRRFLAVVGFAATCLALHGRALAHDAHVHGQASLDAALEGQALSLQLASPLDNLFGFERAPRTDKERADVARAVATLRRADTLFVTPAAAKCRPVSAELDFGKLEGALSGVTSQPQSAARPADSDDSHADLRADYVFHCDNPAALRSLQTRVFSEFPGLRRLAVRLSTPAGQKGATLTPARARLDW